MTAGFLTNVVLDALFISVFRWGTAGAAAATVIAQGVSAALGLVYLFRVKRVFRGVSFRLNRRTVLRLLATSLSPFGLTMLNTVTLVVINRGALAYGGSLAVACYAVMSYAICMVHFIIQGIGDGAQPLLSRYYGAGEQEALAQVRTLTFRSAPAAALLCGIALFLGRSAIPHLFGASNAATRAVPGDPAPVPALSPVHVGSAHPDLLLLRHRADHPGRPADLRPARRAGGPLPDPAPHWAGAVRGLAVRPPDPDPAGRRRGAAAAHRSRRDEAHPRRRAPSRPSPPSLCLCDMDAHRPLSKKRLRALLSGGRAAISVYCQRFPLCLDQLRQLPLVPLSPARRSKIAPNASVPPYQDTSAEAKCVHNSSRSSRLSIKAR